MPGKRILTSIVLLPLIIGMIEKGPFVLFWLFIVAIACIGLSEVYAMLEKLGIENFENFGIAVGAILSLVFVHDVTPVYFVLFSCFSIFLYAFIFQENLSLGARQVCGTFFGLMYVCFFIYHSLLLWKLPDGRDLILGLLIMTVLGDSCAYYVGKNFGERKIAPSVSPNKTFAGVFGSFVGTVLGVSILKFFLVDISITRAILLVLLVGTVGQLGDLFESLLKRGSGVKDSGSIIPGHGGMLDRLDSFIFAIPVFFYLVR